MGIVKKIGIVLLVAVIALLVVFVAQNADYTSVSFFSLSTQMPLSVLLFIAFVLGAAVALSVAYVYHLSSLRKNRREAKLMQHIEEVEKENNDLRQQMQQSAKNQKNTTVIAEADFEEINEQK